MQVTAAYLKAPWQVELRQVELPAEPGPGEVTLRVEACGICGTDLHYAACDAREWMPFGHEVAGVIEQIGPGAGGHLKVGQSVVLETASYCGVCELCRNGRVDLCNKVNGFWGRPAMGMAERMTVLAACVVPYEGLTPEAASLTEPAGVAYDLVKTAGIGLGDQVAVVGPGPIGLMAVALAQRSGAARVVCIGRGRNARRLEIARELGAESVATDEPLDQRKDLARQFQHVLMTAPVKGIPAALGLLAYGGEMTFIGIGTGPGTITFDANDFHFRKLQLRASFASPAVYFPAALQLLKAGIIPAGKIISHQMGLREVGKAMALYRDRKEETGKVVIKS